MRIAVNGTHDAATLDGIVAGARRAAVERFAGYWLGQAFGPDALAALAVAAPHAPGLELGTAVVPIWSHTPQAMAAAALTAQAATGGRLTLGIGLSHRSVVEDMWGLDYRNAALRAREYLAALLPLLEGESVEVHGETLHFTGYLTFESGTAPPPVLLGALGPAMLQVAGECASGTVIGSAGPRVVEEHVAPRIRAAAAARGRPVPRIVANVVALVTDDGEEARSWLRQRLARYGELPSFKAMLEREGVRSQADIALVGDEGAVRAGVQRYAAAGVTDLVVAELGRTPDESERTRRAFARLAGATELVEEER